jgi:hypothetical protein
VPFTIELEQAAMVPVEAGILLDSRISACLRQPSPCDGAENFSNPEELVFGCSDTIDNDSDGKTDLDDEDCVAVQGWSISVATANCFNLGPNTGPLSMRGATTDGTVAALRSAGGMRDPEGNFAQTEVISPNNNGGQQGAVSAIVLSLQAPVFLPQVSENNLVLRLRGNIDASGLTEGQETAPCLVRILGPEEAGLRGSGEPVQTAVTVGGGTDLPNIRNATIKVVLPGEPPPPTEAQTTFKVSVAQPAATAGPK